MVPAPHGSDSTKAIDVPSMIVVFPLIRSTSGSGRVVYGAGVLEELGANSLLKTNSSKQLVVVFGG